MSLLIASVTLCFGSEFVYVANNRFYASVDNSVSAFSVDPTTGALSAVPGSPFLTGAAGNGGGYGARRMVITGNRLYVENNGLNITGFTIDPSTGVLTRIGIFTVNGGGPLALTASRDGKVLIATQNAGPATYWIFAIDPSTGVLTRTGIGQLPSSTFGTSVSGDGKLLVTNSPDNNGNTIRLYSVSPTGLSALTSAVVNFHNTGLDTSCDFSKVIVVGNSSNNVPNNNQYSQVGLYDLVPPAGGTAASLTFHSQVTVDRGAGAGVPDSLAVRLDSNDGRAYIVDRLGTISAVDLTSGSLAPIGTPVLVGIKNSSGLLSSAAFDVVANSTNRFLFNSNSVVSPGLDEIDVFAIAADGSLTSVSGSPFTHSDAFPMTIETYPARTCSLDAIPPTTTLAQSPAPNSSGWNNTDVTISVNAADDTAGSGVKDVQCSKTGAESAASQAVSGTLAIAAEGSTTVSCFATDNAGNQEVAKTITVRIDKTPPAIAPGQLTPAPNAAGWNNSSVVVDYSATDSGSGIDNARSVRPFVLSDEGSAVSGTITVYDIAGNQAAIPTPTVKIDKTPPAIVWGTPNPLPNGAGWNNTAVQLPYTPSDQGSGLTPASSAAAITLTAEGTGLTATVTLTDIAGNSATYTAATTFNIDRTPPLLHAPSNLTLEATGRTGATASFSSSEVSDNLDPQPGVRCSPTSGSLFPLGVTTVSCTATDVSGNTAAANFVVSVIDTTPPTVKVPGNQTLEATDSAGAVFEFSALATDLVDGQVAVTCAPASGSKFAIGANSVTCSAKDAAGNSASASFILTVKDTAPPIITFAGRTRPNANGWNTGPVTLTWNCSDAASGVVASTVTQTITAQGAGLSATGECTDRAGNISTNTQSGIQIDSTLPVLTAVVSPPPNASGWNNTAVTITFACSDALSGVASIAPQQVTVSVSGGGQSVPAQCQDRAGNVATTTVSNINIDLTAPVVGNITATPSVVSSGNSVFTLTASISDDISGTGQAQFTINGGRPAPLTAIGSGQFSASVTGLGVGVYEVCVNAVDQASNASKPSCILAPVYDATAGFVTGGGTMDSPAGAYLADPTLTGKAVFGFESRYQKGANVPTGDTQFQFKVGGLALKSTSYEWLVISGARAQYKGSATINGAGAYAFLVTAIDGDINGGGGIDKFRIKIWDSASGSVVYDNQSGAADTSDAATQISGGSIIIHP